MLRCFFGIFQYDTIITEEQAVFHTQDSCGSKQAPGVRQ